MTELDILGLSSVLLTEFNELGFDLFVTWCVSYVLGVGSDTYWMNLPMFSSLPKPKVLGLRLLAGRVVDWIVEEYIARVDLLLYLG